MSIGREGEKATTLKGPFIFFISEVKLFSGEFGRNESVEWNSKPI